MKVYRINFSGFMDRSLQVVPKLTSSLVKGQMGRVGVVGGSPDYTGAPFYAGQSSLKVGGDLSFVFCAKQAVIPIKSYSPELMVTSFYDDETNLFVDKYQDFFTGPQSHLHKDEEKSVFTFVDHPYVESCASTVIKQFSRLHTLIIGPGLGRGEISKNIAVRIIREARSKNMPIILDADALWVLGQDLQLVKAYKNCVLTPNHAEFDKLVASAITAITSCGDPADSDILDALVSKDPCREVNALSKYLGNVTIVKKGVDDIVSDGEDTYIIDEIGSPRRCGGQGDVFSGVLGTCLHWSVNCDDLTDDGRKAVELLLPDNRIQSADIPINVEAVALASIITKRASSRAFAVHGRSMTTPDVIQALGDVMKASFSS